ncbi:hypothetical protein [Pseudoalteromonas luteoviolacea]|uniref:hypothetical protein n=1 Tax=Pseudoalteromonas luteoviolacea TaxID=43657 RepID=UPI0011547D99|nr:hypothetical protein [Pseudoalteromonas luteoviolacea]TQF67551.1 hypothetical protein FLM44_20430 [Pseudoalteromonas luteoviolacea]
MGLGVTPQTVLPRLWITKLFGEIASGQESHLKSLMDFYNICMDNIMCNSLRLPKRCVLPKMDIHLALQDNMPLPSYCKGMLKALTFIDRNTLRQEQLQSLNWLCETLRGFSSYINARHVFGSEEFSFEKNAQYAKRILTSRISDTVHQMRFSESCREQGHNAVLNEDFDRKGVEAHLQGILTKDDETTLALINDLILVIERELITENFKQRHQMAFDKLYEAQPYLILRSRKAQIQFNMGDIKAATDELEALLPLTLNDAYKNRYQLYNCYIKQKSWSSLDQLLSNKSEGSFGDLATRTLLAYAQEGDTKSARLLKTELKSTYPAVELLFDPAKGDGKSHCELSADTVNEYINRGGKKAWCSVSGGLFWLKAKS